MNQILWKDAYNTGIEIIDEQHKKWFSILDEIYTAHKNNAASAILEETLKKLDEYTQYHFDSELKLMEENDFAQKIEHLKEHDIFRSYLKRFQKDFENNNKILTTLKTIDFMKDWMITHILGTDQELSDGIRNKNNMNYQ